MIKKILLLLALLGFFNNAIYADINSGLNALEKGDYKAALEEFKSLAEQGVTEAQFNLGWMYYKGEGVFKDYKQAVKWYQKAAEKGDAWAQNNLGMMYINGNGVPKDMTKAKYWIKKSL